MAFGMEVIIDIHDCKRWPYTRGDLQWFFEQLCDILDMKREALYFWDYEGEPPGKYAAAPDHLKGISAVQFISTSNITVHTLDVPRAIYLNIFSCKPFDPDVVKAFVRGHFEGVIVSSHTIERV